MIRQHRVLALLLPTAAAIALAATGANTQTTSVRPPVDVNGFQIGVPCDASLGRALSTTASGSIVCTDRIASSNNATTADSAQNALNAVNASNLTGTLDAAQITGQLSNSALPNCPDPAKPIPTASGCVAAGSSGGTGGITCPARGVGLPFVATSPSSGWGPISGFSGTTPSLSTGQSGPFTITASGFPNPGPGYQINLTGSATAACNADGSLTVTSNTSSGEYSWSGTTTVAAPAAPGNSCNLAPWGLGGNVAHGSQTPFTCGDGGSGCYALCTNGNVTFHNP